MGFILFLIALIAIVFLVGPWGIIHTGANGIYFGAIPPGQAMVTRRGQTPTRIILNRRDGKVVDEHDVIIDRPADYMPPAIHPLAKFFEDEYGAIYTGFAPMEMPLTYDMRITRAYANSMKPIILAKYHLTEDQISQWEDHFVIARQFSTKWIYLRQQYPIEYRGLETADKEKAAGSEETKVVAEVDMLMIVTLEIFAPFKALYSIPPVGHYYDYFQTQLSGQLRAYGADHTTQDMFNLRQSKRGNCTEFVKHMLSINSVPTDTDTEHPFSLEDLGMRIVEVDVAEVNYPEAVKAKFAEQIAAEFDLQVAITGAKTAQVKAVGEAKALVIHKRAEATGIKALALAQKAFIHGLMDEVKTVPGGLEVLREYLSKSQVATMQGLKTYIESGGMVIPSISTTSE